MLLLEHEDSNRCASIETTPEFLVFSAGSSSLGHIFEGFMQALTLWATSHLVSYVQTCSIQHLLARLDHGPTHESCLCEVVHTAQPCKSKLSHPRSCAKSEERLTTMGV